MNGPFFSFNGNLRPLSEAVIPVDDLAFAYGFGVYETLKVRKGVLFFEDLHEERLFHSAELLQLDHPWKPGDLQNFLHQLVQANQIDDANLKVLLIGGRTAQESRLYIISLNPLFPDRRNYKSGGTAVTFDGERLYPQAKSLNMLTSYLAFRKAQAAGAHDALLRNRQGHFTEGTRTNFFITDGHRIYSAPAQDILEGVTKLTVTQVMKSLGLELVEKNLGWEEIRQSQGAFLTSTSTKIMPLAKIDDWELPQSDLVHRLMGAYDQYLMDYAQKKGLADHPD